MKYTLSIAAVSMFSLVLGYYFFLVNENSSHINSKTTFSTAPQGRLHLATTGRNQEGISSSESQENADEKIKIDNKKEFNSEESPSISPELDFFNTDELNSAFILSNGMLNKSALEATFKASDLSTVINKIRDTEIDELGAQREQLLYDQITKVLGSNFHSESLSCRQKVCLLELTYSDMVDNVDMQAIRDFGENYIFINKSPTENNEVHFKAVLIATEDASTLTLSP